MAANDLCQGKSDDDNDDGDDDEVEVEIEVDDGDEVEVDDGDEVDVESDALCMSDCDHHISRTETQLLCPLSLLLNSTGYTSLHLCVVHSQQYNLRQLYICCSFTAVLISMHNNAQLWTEMPNCTQ